MYCTSSVFVADSWESPDISQIYSITDDCQKEFELREGSQYKIDLVDLLCFPIYLVQ